METISTTSENVKTSEPHRFVLNKKMLKKNVLNKKDKMNLRNLINILHYEILI